MPPALVVAQFADGLRLTPEQAVRERRFADARGADEADRLAAADVGAQLVEPLPRRRARAHHGHADRRAADGFEHRREIGVEVDLVEHDDGLGAAVPTALM